MPARGGPVEAGREPPALGRVDAHFGEPVGAGVHDVVQQAQLGQSGHSAGIDVFGACLVAGKARFVEQQDRMPGTGQQERGGTPGRSTADHDDLSVGFRDACRRRCATHRLLA